LASEVLRDVRTLDRKIADLNERIEGEVEAWGTTLTEIFGVGPIPAARIIGTEGNVAASRPSPTSLLTQARRRWRLPAGRWCATGSLAGRQSQAQLRPAHGRHLSGQIGRSGRGLLPQEDGGGQVPQGGAAVPQEAHLRRRLQEPRGGLAGTFAQRRLTKRSRERRQGELRRLSLSRIRVNKGKKRRAEAPCSGPCPTLCRLQGILWTTALIMSAALLECIRLRVLRWSLWSPTAVFTKHDSSR
jgi:hypothetical protein